MAQTTTAQVLNDSVIEVSTDDATWTDISGAMNSFEPSGGDRKAGAGHSLASDSPIVRAGKPSEVTVKMKIYYTETAGEATTLLQAWYLANTPVYLRQKPKGTLATYWQFKGLGYFLKPVFPTSDSENEKPVVLDLSWTGSNLLQSAQS